MEKISNCNVKRNKKLLVSDIIKYGTTTNLVEICKL